MIKVSKSWAILNKYLMNLEILLHYFELIAVNKKTGRSSYIHIYPVIWPLMQTISISHEDLQSIDNFK